MAKEYFKKLQSASEQLLNLIGKLERRLFAIPEATYNESKNRQEAED
jgi:hypothetical protein